MDLLLYVAQQLGFEERAQTLLDVVEERAAMRQSIFQHVDAFPAMAAGAFMRSPMNWSGSSGGKNEERNHSKAHR